MFQFANTPEKDSNEKSREDIIFLQKEAGNTIATMLNSLYFLRSGKPDTDEIALFVDCMGADFFLGAGRYLGGKDRDAAIRFVGKKFQRMKEKMEDTEKGFRFDAFEEYLFLESLYQLQTSLDDLPDMKANYLGECMVEQKKVSRQLMERYSYPEKEAKKMARKVCRPDKMFLEWDNFKDDNLYFKDDHSAYFFDDGFVEGMKNLVATGDSFGYSHASVCSIFTDVGVSVPLQLVGTEQPEN